MYYILPYLLVGLLAINHVNAQQDRVSIYFNLDDHHLTPKAQKVLDSIVAAESDQSYVLRLFGHTDITASKSYNVSLSERRVKEVRAYLIEKHGLNSDDITISFMGEEEPVSSNHAKNRRVEIEVILNTLPLASPIQSPINPPWAGVIDSPPSFTVESSGSAGPFDVSIISNTNQMLERNMTTMTESGDPIVSAGIACWEPKPGQTPIEPIILRFPLNSTPWCGPGEMQYYSSVSDSDTSSIMWSMQEDSTPIVVTQNGQDYIEIVISPAALSGCVNMDCPKESVEHDTLFIKSNRFELLAIDMVYEEAFALYEGKEIDDSSWDIKRPSKTYEMPEPKIRLTIRDAKKGTGYAWMTMEDLKEVHQDNYKVRNWRVKRLLSISE